LIGECLLNEYRSKLNNEMFKLSMITTKATLKERMKVYFSD